MPVAAFVLSLLSLIVACLALGWNIASWLLSAGRARCVLLHGSRRSFGTYTSVPVRKDGQPRTVDLDDAAAQGFGGEEVLGVEVQNRGRAPLIVTSFVAAIEPSGLSLISSTADQYGPEMPHTIPPGDVMRWWVRMTDVKETAYLSYDAQPPSDVRAYMAVMTAHRKKVRTKRSLKLTLLGKTEPIGVEESTDPD